MYQPKKLSKDEALKKIKTYCTYQERSHKEVVDRLYGFGLRKAEVDELVANLIEDNYLNEERFAVAFAGGKFRMKQWGRRKIQYEMQQKGVSGYLIKIALKAIDDAEYDKTLEKLASKKWNELSGEHYLTRQSKTISYLFGKGYEQALITKVISELKA